MKILFVSAYFAYPSVAHGGGTDLFHLIEALAERHEVHLISFAEAWEVPFAAEMREFCRSVQLIVPANRWRDKVSSAIKTIRRNPLQAPILLGRRSHSQMRQLIAETVKRETIDLVQFEWTEVARFRNAVSDPNVLTVLDEVDVSFRPRQQALGVEESQRRKRRGERKLTQEIRQELALCRSFDLVLARSQADADLLQSLLPDTAVRVLHPWTRVEEFADIPVQRNEENVLLFVGAMDRPPNEDAVLYFAKEIWPLVKSLHPNVRFLIVGADPTARVRGLASDPSIVVTGYVPDLRPFYERCAVFVAPLRIGGGVINKTIDAMAAGRPVVATPQGCSGIRAKSGAEILIAREAKDFANMVAALLEDHRLWHHIAEGGRDFVRQEFDWPNTVAEVEALYVQLAREESTSIPNATARKMVSNAS